MNIIELLAKTMEAKASDLHIAVEVPPMVRINGSLRKLTNDMVNPADILAVVKEILTEDQWNKLELDGEFDLSYANEELGRFRMNIYKQRGSYGIAIRVVPLSIPTIETLGLPPIIKELAWRKGGLILVTGPTGSGKSTTLASMIDYINKNKKAHILTLEDPVEYLHKHNVSMVNQREIGTDSKSFGNALRAALRQDPDVILVGEMRDLETISTAITAAETGHLVMSTLHTMGASKTVDRIIDVFPPHQQQQIRVQLSGVLEGVISQQLIPCEDGKGRVAALEIMIATPAIRNLIREGKTHQIQTSVQTGGNLGMKSMDNSLIDLFRQGVISKDVLLKYAIDRETVERTIYF